MQFDPGVRSHPYPLRALDKSKASRHSIAFTDAERRQLTRQFRRFVRELNGARTEDLLVSPHARMNGHGKLDVRAVARDFAAMAHAIQQTSKCLVHEGHALSAFAMLHRYIDVIPARADRVIASGLAAAALARSGLRAHVIADSDFGLGYPETVLAPAFALLGINFGALSSQSDNAARRQVWRSEVALASARECAMDFLRDSLGAASSTDQEMLRISRIGRHGAATPVMTGLPCAILIDADSSLIDNARAPVVLTEDGGQLIAENDVATALQMAGELALGEHYHLTGGGAEVQLTDQGLEQFESWRSSLQGIWQAGQVGQMVLGAAIISRSVIEPAKHYHIVANKVRWLVSEKLVPGMSVYPDGLLERFVEALEECEQPETRVTVGRTSYQQIFNHYQHLSGSARSLPGCRPELRAIYGLRSRSRWPLPKSVRFGQAALVGDQENQDAWTMAWARHHNTTSCSLVVVGDADSAARIADLVVEAVPAAVNAAQMSGPECVAELLPGRLVIVTAMLLDQYEPLLPDRQALSVRCLTLYRSTRVAEDRRHLSWRARLVSNTRGADWLVLGESDPLFEGRRLAGLKRQLRLVGTRQGARLLERRIARVQQIMAVEHAATRKALAAHDHAMQGILAFSGRGLFAN